LLRWFQDDDETDQTSSACMHDICVNLILIRARRHFNLSITSLHSSQKMIVTVRNSTPQRAGRVVLLCDNCVFYNNLSRGCERLFQKSKPPNFTFKLLHKLHICMGFLTFFLVQRIAHMARCSQKLLIGL